jgi:hypothetical protein
LVARAQGNVDRRPAHGFDACLDFSASTVEDAEPSTRPETEHFDEVAVRGFI